MNSKAQTRKTSVKRKDLRVRDGRDVSGGLLTTFVAALQQAYYPKAPTGAVRGGGCDDFGCGQTNHNETLLRD